MTQDARASIAADLAFFRAQFDLARSDEMRLLLVGVVTGLRMALASVDPEATVDDES